MLSADDGWSGARNLVEREPARCPPEWRRPVHPGTLAAMIKAREGRTVGHLWTLYEEFSDAQPFPPSKRRVAERLGMSPTAFGSWQHGLSRLPNVQNLLAFADLTGRSYDDVLDAALRDASYVPESAARKRASQDRVHEIAESLWARHQDIGPAMAEAKRYMATGQVTTMEFHAIDEALRVLASDPDPVGRHAAARRGRSVGQQLRRAQDEAGEAGDSDNGPEGSA